MKDMWFHPFFSNGKEKDYESGFHYYGARYYWSEVLTGWLSVDPMADKYPSISPFVYCAWNPVIYVDPDGNKVRFAPGTSEEFKKQFAETIKYMNAKGTAGIFAELESRDETIFIKLYAITSIFCLTELST